MPTRPAVQWRLVAGHPHSRVFCGLRAEMVALNRRLEEVTKENTELRRELQALRATGQYQPGLPEATTSATGAAPCGTGVDDDGRDDDEDMLSQGLGRRGRDPSDTSPGKPRKGARRTVSEGASPHGL